MNHRPKAFLPAARWAALALAVLLCLPLPAAGPSKKLGELPAGTSPDSVDFSASEIFVLDRGTISVYSLPDLAFRRSFCGPGTGNDKLWSRHNWDQTVRLVPGKIIAEDNNKLIFFAPDGRFLGGKTKPENSTWFVPFGKGYAAKSMVVEGTPPLQYIRIALYDAELNEVKELYRQKWFQQQNPPGFSTEFPGDLLHFAVAGDKIFIEESPRGWAIEVFDVQGQKILDVNKPFSPLPVTSADRERDAALVRGEKRVAAMMAMSGSWEKLQKIWSFVFSDFKPALRELQAYGNDVLVRTFEEKNGQAKFLILDPRGNIRKELFLPVGTDAETEARVCGTAFFKIVDGRYYFLLRHPERDVWEIHVAPADGL